MVNKHAKLIFSVYLPNYNNFQFIFSFSRKQILQDLVRNSDLTSEKFKEIQRKVDSNIDSVKPCDEYKDFTEKYK